MCNCKQNNLGNLAVAVGANNELYSNFTQQTTAQNYNTTAGALAKQQAVTIKYGSSDKDVVNGQSESSIPSWVLPVAGIGIAGIILYMITK